MKNVLFGLICLSVSGLAMADFAPVVVDGEIILNYGEVRDAGDMTQFNHDVDVDSRSVVRDNWNLGETDVDTSAIGNVMNIDGLGEIDTVQGVQESNIDARSVVRDNGIPNDELYVDTTAVGNALESGAGVVDSVQFVYDSNINATSVVRENGFGALPLDPQITTTAVGNSMTLPQAGEVASYQLNRNVGVSANARMIGNWGAIGPTNLNTTAVGNSLSIGQ